LRLRLGEAGRDRVKESFELSATVAELRDLMEAVS
jgi:hypothetical protein